MTHTVCENKRNVEWNLGMCMTKKRKKKIKTKIVMVREK
jgi:hypothetical protein